ncbi:MAG TPA: hypothetical protein PKZ32_08765 [Candidatus Melainabacteria bacterium]|nr:hypothetical protein [Candidatus Melainabacteria bacterium]
MDNDDSFGVEITPAAQQFLREHIQSVWQLELILFMKGKSNALSASEIASQLYSNPRIIESALCDFVRGGIFKEKEGSSVYAYEPASVEIADAIEQAGSAYAKKRLSVINFIFSKNDSDKTRA